MPSLEILLEDLDKMPADDIAQFFMRQGITGQFNSKRCPVANYIKSETDNDVAVCQHWVYNRAEAMRNARRDSFNALSYYYFVGPNVAEFISNFDSGLYKELIDATATT